jgi:hypothetical protein
LIVVSRIKTGQNVRELRNKLGNPTSCEVFTFLLEPLVRNTKPKYFVIEGNKSILPWLETGYKKGK